MQVHNMLPDFRTAPRGVCAILSEFDPTLHEQVRQIHELNLPALACDALPERLQFVLRPHHLDTYHGTNNADISFPCSSLHTTHRQPNSFSVWVNLCAPFSPNTH